MTDRCDVLDRMDETLETKIHRHPSLLLIEPTEVPNPHKKKPATPTAAAADAASSPGGDNCSMAVAEGGPEAAAPADADADAGRVEGVVLCCLKFLAVLMRNCVNKHIFSSSEVGGVDSS